MNIDIQNFSWRLPYRSDVFLPAVLLGIAIFIAGQTLWAANVPSDLPAGSEGAENPAEKTAKAETQKKIAALIDQLGDKDFFIREKAQDELSRMGFEAFEPLTAAATHDDLEIATRAKYLLKLMRVEWTAAADPPEVKRLLKGYEMLDADSREERIHALGVLPDNKAIPALCRLVRYEKSSVLSKRAALELIQTAVKDLPTTTQRILIRKNIASGMRPGVQWINAWLRIAREPEKTMDDFKRLIDAELTVLQRNPEDTNPELIASLMRFHIAQLKRLKLNDAVVPAMRRLIDLQKDDSNSIAELAEWFLEQKAWEPLDELAKRFSSRFDSEPIPLYLYAAAKLEQNDGDKAKELAAKALKLNSSRDAVMQHYVVAQLLQRRGLIPWAIAEYEYIIEKSGDRDPSAMRSVFVLAEIYCDQGRNLEAGQTIEKFLKKPFARQILAASPSNDDPFGGGNGPARTSNALKQANSDMYYYFGCHWESQGDRKQQRENMERALKEDPTAINALIGFYHLPDLKPEEKENVVKLIRKSADTSREAIRNAQKPPDDPRESMFAESRESHECNQFAWLIANTEGNFDEALKYAKRAVELQPAAGGIYDTLAHAYYAKGDFENAVKTEEKALELEPHMELVKKKLAVFKKALEEKKSGARG